MRLPLRPFDARQLKNIHEFNILSGLSASPNPAIQAPAAISRGGSSRCSLQALETV
jgi:hypothetical protein